ncbi:hypothetical protein PR003_g30141, partial [Phytophthora rubi]
MLLIFTTILYNNLVPVSLYVSLDIIKVLQTNRITASRQPSTASFRAGWCFPQMKGLKATGPSVGWCFPQIKG